MTTAFFSTRNEEKIPSFPAESSPYPKFGAGELPVEYIPINPSNLKPGDKFGPLPFKISESSHHHHLDFIESIIGSYSFEGNSSLFPFEFWPFPRVMSRWFFGRLNEVISVHAERIVNELPKPDQSLTGEVVVKAISKRDGLCFGFFESILKFPGDRICMISRDALLLANACNLSSLRKSIQLKQGNRDFLDLNVASEIMGPWKLKMRYSWPISKWKNNIHTQIYSRFLGFKNALVEGPGIADIVVCVDKVQKSKRPPFQIKWKYLGPLYHDLPVKLFSAVSGDLNVRKYYLCEFSQQIPSKYPILMKFEVKDL
jgi:hypothetical protein